MAFAQQTLELRALGQQGAPVAKLVIGTDVAKRNGDSIRTSTGSTASAAVDRTCSTWPPRWSSTISTTAAMM
jgi:hypothetical protein